MRKLNTDNCGLTSLDVENCEDVLMKFITDNEITEIISI